MRNLLKMKFMLLAGCMGTACSGIREYSVEYPIYRIPTVGIKDLGFLGVAKSSKISPATQERLLNTLQKCGQYQRVSKLSKVFEIGSLEKDAVQKKLKSEIATYQDARYVHGVLVVEELADKSTTESTNVSVVGIKDGVDHQWYQSFGYTGRPMSSVFGFDEIGPKVNLKTHQIQQKGFEKTVIWRFVLYNKIKEILVLDRRVKMTVRLKNYSAKPRVTDKIMENALGKEMMEHIAGFVCPKIAQAERNLLARKTDAKTDDLVNNGIDLASDDKWEAAANQWKKAVLIDKRNSTAYHNLGIYYERFGNIPAAMEEFSKAKNSGQKDYTQKLYDEALNIYRPKLSPATNDMRVYGIGNAHWLLFYGGEQMNFRIGREYPLYRLTRVSTGQDFVYHGIEMVEVGKVYLVKNESPFVLGRVTQFLAPLGIQNGDVMVTNID